MKTKQLQLILLAFLLPLTSFALVWQDPKTKVNYEYWPENGEACVLKGGLATDGTHVEAGSNVYGNITILEKITVGGQQYTVTSIDNNAFYDCHNLTSITIPSSVTSIGLQAFSRCYKLTSITIPSNVNSIGRYAFYECIGLTSITIPSSVTSIGENPFQNTKWYDSQPDGLLYLDNWLLGYKGDRPTGNLSIATGTRGIADNALYSCNSLTSITIPSSVTSIGRSTFKEWRHELRSF